MNAYFSHTDLQRSRFSVKAQDVDVLPHVTNGVKKLILCCDTLSYVFYNLTKLTR